jgi:hypothetical protein
MTIFVGYPISYEIACELFHQPDSADMEAVIKPTGFDFIYTDKGQYLLGVKVAAASFWDPFVDVDKAVTALLDAKRRVKDLVKLNNLDISNLPLQQMDDEAIPSTNPEPFVFSGAL